MKLGVFIVSIRSSFCVFTSIPRTSNSVRLKSSFYVISKTTLLACRESCNLWSAAVQRLLVRRAADLPASNSVFCTINKSFWCFTVVKTQKANASLLLYWSRSWLRNRMKNKTYQQNTPPITNNAISYQSSYIMVVILWKVVLTETSETKMKYHRSLL